MTHKKINNIREFVWKIIHADIAIKKDISRGILNIRAVANYIINNYKLDVSIDSVISALRRYNISPSKKQEVSDVYSLLRKAEIRTITKMASLSLKKNEEVTKTLGRLLPGIDYEGGEVLRILEGSKLFRIIFEIGSLKNSLFEKTENIASIISLLDDFFVI